MIIANENLTEKQKQMNAIKVLELLKAEAEAN